MLSYRSTRSLPNFKCRRAATAWIAAYNALRSRTRRLRNAPLVLPVLLYLALSGIALAEPVIILDPYFYRTPISEAIDGSNKTVLGYYDETDGKVTPLSNPPRLA